MLNTSTALLNPVYLFFLKIDDFYGIIGLEIFFEYKLEEVKYHFFEADNK